MAKSSVDPQHRAVYSPASYRLRHYRWRSLLTLFGPVIVLGYYIYICVYFLLRPPINNIVLHTNINGNWIFYIWFLLSVLMLEWAKAGLANVEACALMHARLAPSSAARLMWHTDANWANPIWWLRALWAVLSLLHHGKNDRRRGRPSVPGLLWSLLSLITLALYIALPLSGLSIQTEQILTRSPDQAPIYGPSRDRFGFTSAPGKGAARTIPQNIRAAWQSGRSTSPDFGFLYAPSGSPMTSSPYYQSQILIDAPYIEVFVAPAVRDQVVGSVWGLWANTTCRPVQAGELQLIQVNDLFDHTDYSVLLNDSISINTCSTQSFTDCDYEWLPMGQAIPVVPGGADTKDITFPAFVNESGSIDSDYAVHDLIIAADGFNGATLRSSSPFYSENNHDNFTADHFNGQATNHVTTAIMELWLWETRKGTDPYLTGLAGGVSDKGVSEGVQIVYSDVFTYDRDVLLPWAGFGVHCEITSMTGTANIDPASRQFSDFMPESATFDKSINDSSGSAISPRLWPPQIQALAALTSDFGGCMGKTMAISDDMCNNPEHDTIRENDFLWTAIQQSVLQRKVSLNLSADPATSYVNPQRAIDDQLLYVYPQLTPSLLTRSASKLLGESLIALMSIETESEPYYQDLYLLRETTYVVAGPIPWQCVLAFLSIWTLAMAGGACWMLLFAGPRWAPTLNGFEMFKFGARYSNEVDELENVDFRGCPGVLRRIPGMVGLLPGDRRAVQDEPRYLIGLSEVIMGRDLRNTRTKFTFDRREAVAGRNI